MLTWEIAQHLETVVYQAGCFLKLPVLRSNTEHRGQIIWFLMTARPDLMPIDLKRQGRAEEHIALFPPQNRDEKEELLRQCLKKLRLS